MSLMEDQPHRYLPRDRILPRLPSGKMQATVFAPKIEQRITTGLEHSFKHPADKDKVVATVVQSIAFTFKAA